MSERTPSRSVPGSVRSFVGVAAERQTYRNLCYLLLAIPIGIVYQFGLTLGFLGAIFAVVLVGIPILLCTIVGARYLAAFERRLANRLLTTDIRRPADRRTVADDGLVSRLVELVRSQATWKGVGFLVLKSVFSFIVAFLLLLGGIGSLALVLAPISSSTVVFDWEIDTVAESVVAVPLGVGLGLVTLHLANWIAEIMETLAVALLGDQGESSERDPIDPA
ncbi:sensor domain-containing protein [Natrialba aegyptia]|uniref:2-component system sensor kinase n=1 Tax=Natrialba aegyptia DSM 13077 TaxID=1227491 RepID=M0BAT2_9EURY|nr:sensor domain-containing protein [Natrialba aegyptia]ELZ07572.1 2-component system sensor kinase [Natrialba aegyptia DSM 13077]